jgi:hypothetical protein
MEENMEIIVKKDGFNKNFSTCISLHLVCFIIVFKVVGGKKNPFEIVNFPFIIQ